MRDEAWAEIERRILAEESARRLRLTLDDLRKVDQMDQDSEAALVRAATDSDAARKLVQRVADYCGSAPDELFDEITAALAAAREEMRAKCEAELNKLADAALYADAADGFHAAACAIAALAPKEPRR